MAKMINYDDNIFLVNEMLRVLSDALQLEVDPQLYADKIAEDVLFVDMTLEKLHDALSKNPRLIERNNHLRRLMRVENLFAELLESISEERFRLAAALRPHVEGLAARCAAHRKRAHELQQVVASSEPSLADSGDMISPAEYEFLLIDRESEE